MIRLQHPRAVTLPLMAQVDPDIEQMRLVDHGHDHREADEIGARPQHPDVVAGSQRIGEIAA